MKVALVGALGGSREESGCWSLRWEEGKRNDECRACGRLGAAPGLPSPGLYLLCNAGLFQQVLGDGDTLNVKIAAEFQFEKFAKTRGIAVHHLQGGQTWTTRWREGCARIVS